jgi:hypothetical protein
MNPSLVVMNSEPTETVKTYSSRPKRSQENFSQPYVTQYAGQVRGSADLTPSLRNRNMPGTGAMQSQTAEEDATIEIIVNDDDVPMTFPQRVSVRLSLSKSF